MNTKVKFGIGILILILVVAGGLAYSRRASASNSLANMSPTDAMAYRYTAMAKYYMDKASVGNAPSFVGSAGSALLSGVNLNTLSASDAMAYRYTSMAKYYDGLAAQQSAAKSVINSSQVGQERLTTAYPLTGSNLNTLSPIDAMEFRYQALANYYAAHSNAIR